MRRRLGKVGAGVSDQSRQSDLGSATTPAVTTPMRPRLPDRFIDLLACPRCRARTVELLPGGVMCHGCGYIYDVVDGVPILLAERQEVAVKPLDHRSNPVPAGKVRWLESIEGYSLNLGAGATDFVLDRCVELEHAIFLNTDVVGDAHQLPFADEVFEAVLCLNTFEHLREPRLAAAELLRVMRPGARLVLKTAFLQPVHEEPFHFYNATEYGLLSWFEGFNVERCFVPADMSPAVVLGWLVTELLHHVGKHAGPRAMNKVEMSTLREWQRFWTDGDARQGDLWEAVQSLPEDIQKRFSAGFQLEAVKPG
jgi:uncharacterized protein YbaR (Trm112 family)